MKLIKYYLLHLLCLVSSFWVLKIHINLYTSNWFEVYTSNCAVDISNCPEVDTCGKKTYPSTCGWNESYTPPICGAFTTNFAEAVHFGSSELFPFNVDMSVDEGLLSVDADLIKQARSTAKAKVTKNINAINIALVYNDENAFFMNEIDDSRIDELYIKLNTSFDQFQELHERYQAFRLELQGDEEKALVASERDYSKAVETSYSKCCREIIKFRNFKKEIDTKKIYDAEKDTSLTKINNDMLSLKSSLNGEEAVAQKVIDSTDKDVQRTAKSVKIMLEKSFNSYIDKHNEYSNARMAGKELEEKYSAAEDKAAIISRVKETILNLEAIAYKFKDENPEPSRHSGDDRSTDKSIVKLQKLNCPKFSGMPRDFAHFKRDFNLIVKVVGRSDIEVGSHLRDAIPEKHKHLISHLDTSDHTAMMDILEKKFGSKTLVVQDIVAQVEKFKEITTDRGFIDFVEKLQKVKLDLESLSLSSEIANAGYISKIEAKLPINISTDWWKLVGDPGRH